MTPPPAHLVLGPPGHGVRRLTDQLAAAVGAPSVHSWDDAARHERVHVHLTDRLLREAEPHPGAEITRLAARSRLTVTLHDVPQATDGASFPGRREVYRRVLASAHGWAVSSRHEEALVHEHLAPRTPGTVVPLPAPTATAAADDNWPDGGPDGWPDGWPDGPTAAVCGFVYPGKGHLELVRAAGALRGREEVTVLALGAVAPGHDDLAAQLDETARSLGVRFAVTGHLAESQMAAALARVDVGVCGHRNVSASGSMNQWLAAGRRALVRDGRYAREMAALRPGCHALYADGELCDALLAALRSPQLTRLPAGTDTRPHLEDTARDYLAWWRST